MLEMKSYSAKFIIYQTCWHWYVPTESAWNGVFTNSKRIMGYNTLPVIYLVLTK